MKKFLSTVLVVVVLASSSLVLTTGVSAAEANANGVMRRHHRSTTTTTTIDRHDYCIAAYERSIDERYDAGELTRAEADGCKGDSDLRAAYHIENCPRLETPNTSRGQGYGHGCHTR